MNKIISSILIIGFSTFMIMKSQAAFFFPIGPIQDYLRIAKEQLKSLDDQIIFSEKLEQSYAALEKMGLLSAEEVDASNEAWGNKNVREARRVQEMSRLKEMSRSVPAFMPCATVTNTILLKHVYKNQNAFIAKSKENLKSLSMVSNPSDSSKVTVQDKLVEHLKNNIEKNPSIYGVNNTVENKSDDGGSSSLTFNEIDYVEGMDETYIANVSPFFSSDEKYDTLTADQQKAMEGFILLIAPPYQSTTYNKKMEKNNKYLTIKRVAKEIQHNMVNQLFNRLLAKKIALMENYPSEIGLLTKNVKNLYYNPEKPRESVAYKIQMSQMATPTSVQRNFAVLMSNRVHFSILEYEENLKIENILATKLLNKIN